MGQQSLLVFIIIVVLLVALCMIIFYVRHMYRYAFNPLKRLAEIEKDLDDLGCRKVN
jgi:hypothetical protein